MASRIWDPESRIQELGTGIQGLGAGAGIQELGAGAEQDLGAGAGIQDLRAGAGSRSLQASGCLHSEILLAELLL